MKKGLQPHSLQFTYWCQRFEQESKPADVSPAPITLAQLSTPIQAVKEPAANPVAEPTPPAIPGFTQLHLPTPATHSVCPTAVISTGSLMILDLAEKG
jgi:hypothetical protein